MVNLELTGYIKSAIQRGLDQGKIVEGLKVSGWKDEDINEAFTQLNKKNTLNLNLSKISPAQLLLYLGSLIIVIAAVIYITLNWSHWTATLRIMAVLIPMVLMFVIGFCLKFFKRNEPALAFIFTGALLFPLLLIITFKELHLFGDPFSTQFQFPIAFASLILYISLRFLFPSPIWVFLYCAVGAYAWYLLLRFFNIADPAKDSLIWWLMFPLVIVYSLIGVYLEKIGKRDFAKYAYAFACILLIFISSILAFSGDLIKPIFGFLIKEKELPAFSYLTLGGIYLVLSLICQRSKKMGLEEPQQYSQLFDLFGVFYVLGSIFSLGLGANKPLYESALLVLSLVFIFSSTIKISKSFLYIGTLFLIVYIFNIGGEYFHDKIGWPVTLLIAGLLSMGAGLAIEQIRKKYFVVKTTV